VPRCKVLTNLRANEGTFVLGDIAELEQATIDALPEGTVRLLAEAPPPLRTDGPTLEEYVSAGNEPASYPPAGYTERESEGLTAFREQQKADELEAAKARVASLLGTKSEPGTPVEPVAPPAPTKDSKKK
jgi:hypothetical protein